MSSWLDTDTYTSQFSSLEDLDGHVPRPDDFPEDPADSTSYWIKEHPIELDTKDSKLPQSEVDIVIVGSGITGAVAAYHISERQPNLRVALLEARGICTGATGRNGGFLARPECYHIAKSAKAVGVEEAIQLKKFPIRTRDMMLECIEKLGAAAEVDLRLSGNVLVFETAEEQDLALKDLKFAGEHGYEPECYYIEPDETSKRFGLPAESCKYGAAYLQKAGTFYPRKFVHLLLRTALSRMQSSFSIHAFTPVTSVTKTANETYDVTTTRGTIKARAVLHATNAYAGNICASLKGRNGVFGAKAHLIAVKPTAPSCTKQLGYGFGLADYWHYLHQRPKLGAFLYGLADAEVLNDYNDSITLPADHMVRAKMAQFLESTFPDWFARKIDWSTDVTHDWTGIQGLTLTGASIVGRPSEDSRGEFASVGHNGEGMGRCFSCAVVVTDALLAYLDGQKYTVPDWFPSTYRRNI